MPNPESIARELLDLWGQQRQIPPLTKSHSEFSLADAYDVSEQIQRLRMNRGEVPAGRKIGFTNQTIWKDHGISAPIWAPIYDTTIRRWTEPSSFALNGFPEPRIEPELILHLARSPEPGMNAIDLTRCIDWVAPGFEIVSSVFPDWKFAAADAAAAFGVHCALFVGPPVALINELPEFDVELRERDGIARNGSSKNVLGGPISALHFLHRELQRYPGQSPLKAGEIITTGTLTEAMPASPGQSWAFSMSGIDCPAIHLSFT